MDSSYQTVAQLKALSAPSIAFQGVFIINKIQSRTTKTGSSYWSIELADSTGTFNCNCFHSTPVFDFCQTAQEGMVVEVTGQTDYYQERLSPKLQNIQQLDEQQAQAWMPQLKCSSEEDPDALWAQLQTYVQAIQHTALQQTAIRVFEEIEPVFKDCPAAIHMHHAYQHGLLEHTVHVGRVAQALLPLYPQVHADLALTGALLHDVGKAIEYVFDRVTKKSLLGQLQGHVVLGYRLVRKAAIQSGLEAELLERLEHIILSHQGELEWGAAVLAATPEAVFVSMIDHLDAKMGVVQHTLRQGGKGFSAYLPALKTSLLVDPVSTET